MDSEVVSAEKIIFITGTGRSGTNILKKILGENTNVATLPFEYRFTVDPKGILDFYNTFPSIWSPYWADAKIKELETFLHYLAKLSTEKIDRTKDAKILNPSGLKITPPPYTGWEMDNWFPNYSEFVGTLISSLVEFKYSAVWPGTKEGIDGNEMYFSGALTKNELNKPLSRFLKSCFDAICAQQDKKFFVEDNTHSLLFAKDLMDLVPNGKIIHVVRDPRDVIASLINQRWAPRNLNQAIRWFGEIHSGWQKQRSMLNSEQFMEVRFEDLINDLQGQLTKINALTGIDIQPSMLQVDLMNNNIGRYKKDLSMPEIQNIESQCADILEHYQYSFAKL
jgi:hypothetical protein